MVNWTGEKDAQLLLGIFEYQNISFSKELLQHLAGKIGEGCTPKAVSHRLNNIKARAKNANGADGSASSTSGAPAPTTGTPRKRNSSKKTATSKSKSSDTYGDLQGYDELFPTTSVGKGKKRGRLLDKAAVDEDNQGETKRVKTEDKDNMNGFDGDGYGEFSEILGGRASVSGTEENGEDDTIRV